MPLSLSLDLGFLALTLLLDGAEVLVGDASGERVLFIANHPGRLAIAHLTADPAILPWEDTDTVRLCIVQAVNEARGFPTRTMAASRAGTAGDFFLERPSFGVRREMQREGRAS
jgi:hypothetical protein